MKKLKLLFAAAALLLCAGVQAQKDVTSQYITNATLSSTTGWTISNFNDGPTQGNNTTGYAMESYAGWESVERPTYGMTQEITLPKGNYRLVNYSFYRYGSSYDTNAEISEAYLKAGNNQVTVKTLGSLEGQQAYAHSMAEAANRFETKMYRNVVEFDIAEDNTAIEIGIVGTHSEPKSWFICGMFELFDLNDKASVSSPTDMTYAITNPGFEYLNLTGWTTVKGSNDKTFWYMDNTALSGKSGVAWIETYEGSGIGTGRAIYQDLTGLDNGLYEVTVYGHLQQGSGSDGFYLYANDDKVAIGSTDNDYSVRTTVTDGNLRIKLGTDNCNGNWAAFDKVRMKFYGDPLEAYQDLLDNAVNAAQDYIDSNPSLSDAQIAALQAIVNANDNDDNAFTEESQFNTAIETINAAVETYKAMVAPYAIFNALKPKAVAIAAVDYTETTSGSHTTFNDAITAQTTAADNATTAEAIVTATNTLKAAIKTYISGAEPTSGNSFEITCLVENPSFDNNTVDGWTRTYSSGGNAQTQYTCNEFWNNTFDFYQDLTDLPNGSYQLSVQAFSRPGDNGPAYTAYKNGTNSVTAELYVNNDASTVGNIYAYTGNTAGPKVEGGSFPDYKCVVEGGTDYWVPNGMEGANLYFADENVYKTTVAALVEDGNLRIGFRDETLTTSQWTIFDNFRLFYYGSDKMIYYKQYLPQLEAEIAADYLNNALYAVLKDGQTERAALAQANSADANTLTTETQFEQAIEAITTARVAFVNAKAAYDNLALGLASSAYNVGDGVFQMSASQGQTFANVLAAGQTMYNTGTASLAKVTAQITDISNAYVLNAPDASKRYKLTLTGKGALTFKKGGAADEGGYENPFMEANDNLAQHFTLTKVTNPLNPNVYTLSFVDLDGNTRYICVGEEAKEGLGNEKIRTTTVATDALPIIILGTTTEGVFNMVNSVTESKLGSNGGGLYTTNDATNFTIAEATQATVKVKIDADVKYGTRIFPFTPTLPEGVVAYTCTVEGNALNLAEVETPVADAPYVLYAENGVAENSQQGWGLAGALTKEGGSLVGVYAAQAAPVGSYVLQNNDNKVAFYKVAEGKQPTVGANRCYLTEPVATARPAYFFDGETTAIEALDALTSGDAEFFNAAGARIPALQKGVNIVRRADGTSYKVIVK